MKIITSFGVAFAILVLGGLKTIGQTYSEYELNATQTEERRVDQLYTFSNTPYTYENGDSLGTAFTCKRFLTDTSGNTNTIIEGTMSWDVTPTGTNTGPVLCVGNFTLGQPMY